MAKNRHQKKPEKKSKFDKKNIVSFLIIVLMVSSVAGFVANYNSSNSVNINGHKFTFTQDGLWTTKINGEDLFFYNSPDITYDLPEDFKTQLKELNYLAVTRDYNNSMDSIISALRFEVATYTDLTVVGGYTINETELPQITCEDLSTVYIIPANESSIEEDKCLKLYAASSYDIALYRDSLIYAYYGII